MLLYERELKEIASKIMCNSRVFLGVSDLAVETVFRNVDGFVTPWMNWDSGKPNGRAGHAQGTDDLVTRSINGKWRDGSLSTSRIFYCEGNKSHPFTMVSTEV